MLTTAGSISTTTPSNDPPGRLYLILKMHPSQVQTPGWNIWTTIASPVETVKLDDVDPLAHLWDILTRIVNGHPNTQIDEMLPSTYAAKPELKAVA